MSKSISTFLSDGIDIPKNGRDGDYVYKIAGGKKLSITFLEPKKKVYEKAPVYFIITGGGWKKSVRQDIIGFSQISCDALSEKGFAIVSVEYRIGEVDDVVLSDIISDCFDALHYINYFSDVLNIDMQKIVLSGHSAGAHLALMLAYAAPGIFPCAYCAEKEYTVTSVAAMSPPTTLRVEGVPETLWFSTDDLFEGCNTDAERAKVSPLSYVTANVPKTILFAGTKDPLVYPISSQLLYDELVSCGVECKLVLSENSGHCYEKLADEAEPSIPMSEVQQMIVDFVS